MKFTLFAILNLVGVYLAAQPPVLFSEAAIEINLSEYDFGEITQTEKGSYTYCELTVKNIGNAPLIISKCKGSCGCTLPECPKTPILPNEEAIIKVRYDSNRMGSFSKTVTVFSNAENEPEAKVIIKGTVIA